MMNSRLGPGEETSTVNGRQCYHSLIPVAFVRRRPTCILGYNIHILLPHLSHVAKHGKDDKAGQEASQAVH